MIGDPISWSWPQWVLAAALLGHVLLHAVQHGDTLRTANQLPGECARYNGFSAAIRATLILLLLTAGGFYR